MVGLCGVEILSQFFFAHGMCWKHGVCALLKKLRIQSSSVLYLIASTWWCSCPSTQMRPLMISRHVEKRWWWKFLITYNMVLLGQDTFGLYIVNSIGKWSPFQVWHNLKCFCYGCITWMHVHFLHIIELHRGLKICCSCACRALDGWASSCATFKSRHIS